MRQAVRRLGRFGVDELFSFVISQDGAFVVLFDDVLRVDWNLAAAAGAVDDELRDGVAGGMTAEAFDDLDSFGDSGAEVGGALDEIALVKVVGTDTTHEELLDEFLLGLDGVVHVFEED